ncbi:Transcriptional regulator of nonfermentable carbon utilization [Puttea exsequens]|nr:Transcriptional regulator of nonfermentable carbon utilization [Puttea exsequens]
MALNQDDAAPSRSHSESSDDSDSQDSDDMRNAEAPGARKPGDGKVKKPVNRDPNRVKRKKARRACENCQRAHLTCSKSAAIAALSFVSLADYVGQGDNRPCERCGDKKICKDGKRKKAKYLEGTADEDLTPVQEKEAEQQAAQRAAMSRNRAARFPYGFPGLGPGGMYPGQQPAPSAYPLYASGGTQSHMAQPYGNQMMPLSHSYSYGQQPHQSAMPTYNGPPQQNAPMGSVPMHNSLANQNHLASDLFPDLNLEDNDFDNNYGYGEYHALGQMSSGVVDTPPSESTGAYDAGDAKYASGMMSTSYGSSPTSAQQYQYPQPDTRQGAIAYNLGGPGDAFNDYIKEEDSSIFHGRSSNAYLTPMSGPSPQGMMAGFEGNSSSNKDMNTNTSNSHQAPALPTVGPHSRPTSQQGSVNSNTSASATNVSQLATTSVPITSAILTTMAAPAPQPKIAQTNSSRRSRNPSTIYNTVTEPYSYTKAFHDLMALIRRRFSQKRTAHIAKALASIRPSFISSLTKLDDDDRVFMEKCLQRTLLEYEDNLSLTGTPTILCRRTGEVIAVSDGFSILSGWRRPVLLGREPNLNVNTGGSASVPLGTGASTSRGTNTPRNPENIPDEPQRPKPVSIVDLLDDESACDFFDDYAHLAFGDSRGSVTTPCKLLKYRTAKDSSNLDSELGSRLKRQHDGSGRPKSSEGIGGDDGKVECMLCWSVKRDVFDIPMLFVMNVLPCI